MPIFTELNREVGPRVAEDFPASLGESLRARFASSFAVAGADPLKRLAEREIAAGGERRERAFGVIGAGLGFGLGINPFGAFFSSQDVARQTEREREVLTPEVANERAEGLGLKFDRPITVDEFQLIVDQKKKELAWQSLRQRAPKTITSKTLGLATDLFAQLVDPINIASAFIPIVGESKFFLAVRKLGLTRARFARGATEGFVGNLLVEPIVAVNASREQADYTMADSLMNLAFGTVIGGGLHTVGGRIGDLRRGGPPIDPSTIKAPDGVTPPDIPSRSTQIQQRLDDGADPQDLVDEGLITPDEARGLEFEEREFTNAERVEGLTLEERADVQGAAVADLVEGRHIEVTPVFRRGPNGEELVDFEEAGAGGLTPDQIRDRDFEELARAQEQLEADVDSTIARQTDPDAQRLSSAEESTVAKQVREEAPDTSKLDVVQRATDEDEDILNTELEELAQTEQGREILEQAGIEVREDGTARIEILETVDKEIVRTAKLGNAIEAAGACIIRNS